MPSIKTSETIIDQALAREPADLVIKNVTVLNVATGTRMLADIAITGEDISALGIQDTGIVTAPEHYAGKCEIDGTGLFAVPGFIDTHIHIESTILQPQEFDRCALPMGTTTVICDPHEIANVLGSEGIEYFFKSAENTVMDIFVQLSSCVPATRMETSGADLGAADLLKFKGRYHELGLAEFMDIGGVLNKDSRALAKLEAFDGSHVGGHLPGVRGHALNAMLNFVCDCHESTTPAEAREKMEKGGVVFIREGTAAKNLTDLFNIIQPYTSPRLGFCSDDRKPTDIRREGHIDHLIRRSLALGADIATVYRIASLSAADHYGLKDRGLIAPGRKADIVLLKNLQTCDIHSVIKNGAPVDEARFARRPVVAPIGYNSVKLKPVTAADFAIKDQGKLVDVIGLIPNQIVTEHLTKTMPSQGGALLADPANDTLKIAVLERHGRNGNIGRSFVKGFGIDFTIGSSVAHDNHNLVIAGPNDADMAVAANRLRDIQGGFVVVKDGAVLAELPLPIAGLMSDKPFEEVIEQLDVLAAVVNPRLFLSLAFLALCVIPNLKITDYGVTKFDPANGDLGPKLIDDQRVAVARLKI